jgi:hypothetical protein
MNDDRIVGLLGEIRDNQREMLERQRIQLETAQRHLEQAKVQVAEGLALQREAVSRVRIMVRLGVPGILLCIATIIYIMVRYL